MLIVWPKVCLGVNVLLFGVRSGGRLGDEILKYNK